MAAPDRYDRNIDEVLRNLVEKELFSRNKSSSRKEDRDQPVGGQPAFWLSSLFLQITSYISNPSEMVTSRKALSHGLGFSIRTRVPALSRYHYLEFTPKSWLSSQLNK